ncbi:UvrD-helicase domain-containing protein [bacterium]|nr:UvrD-helicase domain-containing protein [bacterium]
MQFLADLHIHSHFSIATSKLAIPEYLDAWARIKGITVVGTGDITHPGWLTELKEKLVPAEEGLYRLKQAFDPPAPLDHSDLQEAPVRFLLTAEISNIYKRGDKTRKVHNLIFLPSFDAAARLQARLDEIGNITSDGRPILGLDSRDLLEICLETDENILFIPAHIWTPWFSALGSKSGFDSIDEAYADLAHHIRVVETGLSADPPMHWMASHLDRFTIISNSDAHSPEKLGREANLLDTELSYHSIVSAFKSNDPEQLLGTVEFFPQEGKYHYDGHRKCDICWDPVETLRHKTICSACGKPVTVGVMHRAVALSDRSSIIEKDGQRPYWAVIPLKEIISEIEGVGPASKRVGRIYHQLISRLGAELPILLNLPLDIIASSGGEILAEAIDRVRQRQVYIREGYDGEFGRITVFAPGKKKVSKSQVSLFNIEGAPTRPESRAAISFNMEACREIMQKEGSDLATSESLIIDDSDENLSQKRAIMHDDGPAIVLAGPGTGKTRVATQRMVRLIDQGLPGSSILALTFTNKAALEISERLDMLLDDEAEKPLVTTFHSLGYMLLSEFESTGTVAHILDRPQQEEYIQEQCNCSKKEAAQLAERISAAKRMLLTYDKVDADFMPFYRQYEQEKRDAGLWDLDDLIFRMVRLLEKDIDTLITIVRRWPVILIDEYQDVNEAQYRLVRLLAPSGRSNLMVIGDPDQAIYGFRGANAGYINMFQKDFPRARMYLLTKSYRCSDTILSASQSVLSNTRSGQLQGVHPGVRIKITNQPTGKSEAEFIARTIERLMGGLSFFSMDSNITSGASADIDSLAQVAVICRTRRQFSLIEKAFNDHSIPYQTVGNKPYYKREPLRQLLVAAMWIWSELHPFIETQISARFPDLFKQREKWILLLAGLKLDSALKLLAEPLGLAAHAELERLLRQAERYGRDRQAFLRDFALGQGADTWDKDIEQVSLMTLHAAKGLEFDAVFIPGCEEGLLPFIRQGRDIDVEEERRLLYVGMTRARRLLYLCHAGKRSLMGEMRDTIRSSFLDSIEEALLERIVQERPMHKRERSDQLGLF